MDEQSEDHTSSRSTIPHLTMSKVLYLNKPVQLDIGNQVDCFQFIKTTVLDDTLKSDSVRESFKVTKNDNIKKSIDKLMRLLGPTSSICCYAYGSHLQKLLTVIEIYKQKSDKSIVQFNKLQSFTVIKEKHGNELLDQKLIVPIMIIVLSSEGSNNFLESLENEGFTKQ